MLSFSSYGWLTVIAFLHSSEDKNTHSWLPRHLLVRSVLQDSFGSAERSSEKPINIVSKPTPPSCNHRYWSIGNASYPTTRPCLGLSVNSYRLRSHTDTLETKRLQAFHAFWSSWALCAADRLVAVLCFTAVSI